MGKRRRALVIAEIPAPYRVDIFLEMAKYVDMVVYFDSNKDQSRSPEYFVKSDELSFLTLDNPKGKKQFRNDLSNIKEYDFVLAYHPVCKPALLAQTLCRIYHIPYYVNIDGAFVNPNLIRDAIKRFVYRGARGCFSGGDSATKYFLHYGVKQQNIYSYNFTSLHEEDIEASVISQEQKVLLRKELSIPEKKTVIAIGQFIPRKGFDVLLKAWKRMETQDAQLLLFGGGPEREKYERYILDNKLQNVMLFDFISKQKLKKYYLASDVFVLPTREDIWGLVINEAMAVALPVVTTNMCNAGTQLIENGVNGFIVPVEDDAALAEKMLTIVKSKDIRAMAENSLEKIKHYTIKNAAESHMHAIEETLKQESYGS